MSDIAPKLLAIDGQSIVRRCYEAIAAPDSAAKAADAMKAAFGSFRRALREHAPTHVLLALDGPGTTWRHQAYPLYKATRKPTPIHFAEALPGLADRLRRELGLAVVQLPGVEGDDVIGTGVTVWDRQGRGTAVVLSTDKDLLQLVTESVWVWDHFKGFWKDPQWVQEKYGVPPQRLADYLALIGDTVDSIPGVPGVAHKTALKLFNEYGDSLRAIVEQSDKVKGVLGEALRSHVAQLRIARRLTGLKTDVPLGVSWSQLRWAGFPESTPAVAPAAS